jgi:Kef-type K+ transport system membrane component KefB
MFLVGLELEPDTLKKSLKKYSVISTIGVIVPFGLSLPVSYFLFQDPQWRGQSASLPNFMLFMGVAIGVSALPVLARILAERHMLHSSLGVVTMAATAIGNSCLTQLTLR